MLARPAGLEPATPGLEGRGYEAAGGSVEPLPPFLLAFCQPPNHLRPPRAATDCQSFVSRLAAQRAGAQARATREGLRDLALGRPRACGAGPANRMNLSGCRRLATEMS